ncbi:N-acetyltransferase [Fulvivirga maritima]|uniref:GNAT family N-acetyltransferase n=1 Tax=Fulvivirga maritima TaxID=2904247 RepID=UPI001F1E2399|nr:GNAT family N-acetyltransferase [Fulvivirga maritima]UII24761.1 N-acetyltransferase [Fulvivirga maritima]
MNYTVRLDMAGKRFTTIVDGKECYLQFKQMAPQVLDFEYIFVPEEVRSRGIGSNLVYNALIFAQKEHLEIIAGCAFVQDYMTKHPEFRCVSWKEAV